MLMFIISPIDDCNIKTCGGRGQSLLSASMYRNLSATPTSFAMYGSFSV